METSKFVIVVIIIDIVFGTTPWKLDSDASQGRTNRQTTTTTSTTSATTTTTTTTTKSIEALSISDALGIWKEKSKFEA